MTSLDFLPSLEGLEPTRKTMHLYAQAIGVVPRTHADPHPKWWHISLKVRPEGLVTDSMALPGGGTFSLRMDLRKHMVVLQTSRGERTEVSMQEGLTGTAFGEQLLGVVSDLGLRGEYPRERFESEEPRTYDPDAAERFFTALVNVDHVFKKHRLTLSGEFGPVQLWPHGFDLAFEWFGTRQVEYEENGKVEKLPSQLNLGFYPGQPEPYFYSNPWPFEADRLLEHELPSGARWHTEGWEGTYLPYASLAGKADAEDRLLAFARRVYEISRPTLMA